MINHLLNLNHKIMENNLKNQEQTAMSVFSQPLADLSKAVPEPVEMAGDYWSPEKEGETKRLFFAGLGIEQAVNMDTGETVELPTARFVESKGNDLRVIRNSSRRLVGIFESFAATIKEGDAFEIKYLGKIKNKNNGFKSDNWSVKRLVISTQQSKA